MGRRETVDWQQWERKVQYWYQKHVARFAVEVNIFFCRGKSRQKSRDKKWKRCEKRRYFRTKLIDKIVSGNNAN